MDKELLKELLKKYIEKKLNDEEEKKFVELLNNSENSEISNDLIKDIWEKENENENLGLNSTILWKNLKSKIAHDSEVSIYKRNTFIDTLYNTIKFAAAIILIIIGIYFFKIYLYSEKPIKLTQSLIHYYVPFGSKSNIILSDGSKVWINSGSTFRYTNDYGINNRIVFLEGEAYFEVVSNKKIPFCVKVGENIIIKAYGTKFNVRSLKEEDKVETILISGNVTIERTDKNGKVIDNIEMKPNEIVTYLKHINKFTIIKEKFHNNFIMPNNTTKNAEIVINPLVKSDIESAIAWKNNRLIFRSENIESIISKLERWYNVEIILKNEKLKEYKFTGSFDNETIEQALEALKLTAPFSYIIKKNKIIIY